MLAPGAERRGRRAPEPAVLGDFPDHHQPIGFPEGKRSEDDRREGSRRSPVDDAIPRAQRRDRGEGEARALAEGSDGVAELAEECRPSRSLRPQRERRAHARGRAARATRRRRGRRRSGARRRPRRSSGSKGRTSEEEAREEAGQRQGARAADEHADRGQAQGRSITSRRTSRGPAPRAVRIADLAAALGHPVGDDPGDADGGEGQREGAEEGEQQAW